jgi:hypothetical protein
MAQLSNYNTKRAITRIGIMLFMPVYAEVFRYLGWSKMSFGLTCVVLLALFWSIASGFRRRPN